MRELIQEQDNEIEKAVISNGKYVVIPEFKRLVKTEQEWFTKMKEADRIRHLQRFAAFKLPEISPLVSRVPAVENHKTGGRVRFKGGYMV